MRAPLSWRRVLVLAGVAGALAFAIAYAPLAMDAYEQHREREAAKPRPIVATDAQQAAIIRALMLGIEGWGPLPPLPPRPPPGSTEDWPIYSSVDHGLPKLLDRTVALRFCPGTEADVSPPLDCPLPPPGRVFANWLYSDHEFLRDIPLRLRREMVMANATSMPQPDPALPGTGLLHDPGADTRPDSVPRAPGGAGALETTRAVLRADGNEALVYGATLCGPNCDTGALFLFARDGERWRLSAMLDFWGHPTIRCADREGRDPPSIACGDRATLRQP